MPLETPRATHGLISIRTSYHFKSLRSRFAEFHAEFDVCSLLQFHVHAEITNVKAHVVTNTHVVQLQMPTQRHHSAYWVATFPAPKHSARIHVLPSVGSLWNKSRNFLIHLCTYHVLSEGEGRRRPGHGIDHPPPSSAEDKERVQLYLYSPSGPSCPFLGWNLPLRHIL